MGTALHSIAILKKLKLELQTYVFFGWLTGPSSPHSKFSIRIADDRRRVSEFGGRVLYRLLIEV